MKPGVVRSPAVAEIWFEESCFVSELRNSPDDPDLSVARVRVAARTATKWHRLDVDERYLITDGTGITELDGTPPAAVRPGDVIVVPAGCAPRIRNDSDRDLVLYCLCTPRFTADAYHDATGERAL